MATPDQLLAALAAVIDPNTGKDFVSTKALKNLKVDGGRVSFDVELGYPARSQHAALRQALTAAARGVAGIGGLSCEFVRFITISSSSSAPFCGRVDSIRVMAFQLPDSSMMNVNSSPSMARRLSSILHPQLLTWRVMVLTIPGRSAPSAPTPPPQLPGPSSADRSPNFDCRAG